MEKKTKKGDKEMVKQVAGLEGLEGRLIPTRLIIQEYFAAEQKAINDLEAQAEALIAGMEELRDEHGAEDGLLANAMDDKGKISRANLSKAIKAAAAAETQNLASPQPTGQDTEEFDLLTAYKKQMDEEADTQASIKAAKAELEKKVVAQYPRAFSSRLSGQSLGW
jgi:type I restriction enzyme M protein